MRFILLVLLLFSTQFLFGQNQHSNDDDKTIRIKVPKGHKVIVDSSDTEYVPVPGPGEPPIETTLPTIKIDDFRMESDSDYYPAWVKAKAALVNGGTILFGEGVYMIKTNPKGWYLEKDNLTLKGAGMDKTIITCDSNNGILMTNDARLTEPYVRGFRLTDTAYTFTYENTMVKGDSFIVMKEQRYADSIKVGSKLVFTAGSHYFDQDFGELMTVVGKEGRKLFLKDKLSGSYQVDSVPFANKTTSGFIMPDIGRMVEIYVDVWREPLVGRLISVGDNIFGVMSFNDSLKSYVLLNIGRGNVQAGTFIPGGTTITKMRVALLWNHTKNLKIQDMTLRGPQDRVLRLDNTYGAEISRVKIVRTSTVRSGFVYTVDFARGISFDGCHFIGETGRSTSQISRSSGDVSWNNCYFYNNSTDCSEYSFNLNFDSCEFYFKGDRGFVLGNTVRHSYITNSTFNIDSCLGTFWHTGEIQSLIRIQRYYSLIQNNRFNVLNIAYGVMDLSVYGRNDFIGNTIVGGTTNAFAGALNREATTTGFYPTFHNITGNSFNLNFAKYFISGGVIRGTVDSNTVINKGVPVSIFGNFSKSNGTIISNNLFQTFKSPMILPPNAKSVNNIIRQ